MASLIERGCINTLCIKLSEKHMLLYYMNFYLDNKVSINCSKIKQYSELKLKNQIMVGQW